ncbi:amidohydrolase [Caproiciproducens sp. NJN-50]|uniref:amidohydrolase n=1 Tax=Acutalibacteraceae TaxID=3082771 RepID=UPI000FFDF851|nr:MULTISPECIES: amidohydrolase [Acutalibacteraceae]QAT50211.1 amidohydrolase [Caproiciproducens sp. NJN-50]
MKTNDFALDETKLFQTFQWLHRHPELSFQEFETTKKIRELLCAADIEILDLPLETGLVAEVAGARPGPIIAVRCDIDALPIQEQTDLDYKSENDGIMHACGHDFHTAAMFGAALLLKRREKELQGTVRIIFQPGEESSLGALKITESGALDHAQAIFGIHVIPNIPVGTVVISPGAMTAAVDRFEITISGKGVHAAYPQDGIDPIVTAAQFISAAQTIVSRNTNPFHQSLVSITHVAAGSTWNVIPSSAFLEGTVRTLQKEDRQSIPKRLEELAGNIAEAFRAKADFRWIAGPPATDNDPRWTAFAAETAEDAGLRVVPAIPALGGEDFAFYQQTLRGVYIQIGTGESEPNHNPKFRVDPKALPAASAYVASLAEKALQTLKSGGTV